jgi:D-alanyl-D-alanine carboxypeptidase
MVAVFGGETSRSRDRRVAELLDQGFARMGEPQIARAETKSAAKNAKKTVPTAATAIEASGKEGSGKLEAPRLEASDIEALTGEAPDAASAGDASPATQTAAVAAGWSIQTGAYSKLEAAEKAASSTQRSLKLLAQGKAAVAKPEGGDKLFRARVVGLNEKQAKAACAEIKKKNRTCVALPPNPNVSVAYIGG